MCVCMCMCVKGDALPLICEGVAISVTLQKISSFSLSAMVEEENGFIAAGVNGMCNSPVGATCLPLMKPKFNEADKHCSLDVVPILIEEGSFPAEEKCGFRSELDQDVYSISMLSEEGNVSPQCASQLEFLSFVGLPLQPKNQLCLDTESVCRDFIDLQMESAESYAPPCIVDIAIEVENLEKPKFDGKPVGSEKSDGPKHHSQEVLQRQASLKSCGRFMQFLTNQCHGLPLLKLVHGGKSFTERNHDMLNNKWRKYKRAASFDSRKVVLLFSFLSSLGTLVLIYLTLRVRQTTEGFANV